MEAPRDTVHVVLNYIMVMNNLLHVVSYLRALLRSQGLWLKCHSVKAKSRGKAQSFGKAAFYRHLFLGCDPRLAQEHHSAVIIVLKTHASVRI